jgi:hypothetical protein
MMIPSQLVSTPEDSYPEQEGGSVAKETAQDRHPLKRTVTVRYRIIGASVSTQQYVLCNDGNTNTVPTYTRFL